MSKRSSSKRKHKFAAVEAALKSDAADGQGPGGRRFANCSAHGLISEAKDGARWCCP